MSPVGRYVGDLLRVALDNLPAGPPPAPAPPAACVPATLTPAAVSSCRCGSASATTHHAAREGQDGEPWQFTAADTATVLRILRADRAWVERDGSDDDGNDDDGGGA